MLKAASFHKVLDAAADRVGAQEHRLQFAAGMHEALGKDMPALRVCAELDLIDRQEIHRHADRHAFDRRHPVARIVGDDLLFAGDQRDVHRAHTVFHPVIDLPGEQPQRQADHAGFVPQHALDCQVGLAGIGRAEQGPDAGVRVHARAGGRTHHTRGLGTAGHDGAHLGSRPPDWQGEFCVVFQGRSGSRFTKRTNP